MCVPYARVGQPRLGLSLLLAVTCALRSCGATKRSLSRAELLQVCPTLVWGNPLRNSVSHAMRFRRQQSSG